jgi:hypothetical protein
VTESPVRAEGPAGEDPSAHDSLGRAVDRPAFWWSIGAVFLVNAALSAAERQWAVALLQGLTFLWAVVAGVTARNVPPVPGR